MNDNPDRARSLRRTLLSCVVCVGATAAQNATNDPPPLAVEYLDDGGWVPVPPGQSGFTSFRVVASTAAGAATGTWWVPLAFVHVMAGSTGEAHILGGHMEFAYLLDTVPQPYPPLASVVGPIGSASSYAAAAEWALPQPWVQSLTALVFAGSGAGSNVERWCVPTWNPDGDPEAASPFFNSHWWDPQNFWSELVSDGQLVNQDAALQVLMAVAAGGLPPEFFASDDYLRLYKSLAIRLQMVGYRDDNLALASYPKQPLMLPPPIGTDPPPKLPSGPSQFKITIGTPGEWVTVGTRPGFAMATLQPPTYTGEIGRPLTMAFVGFVPHTTLHLRSIAPPGCAPLEYAVDARWASPGRIRILLDVAGGRTYEVWRVSNPLGESDLVGGERARIRVP